MIFDEAADIVVKKAQRFVPEMNGTVSDSSVEIVGDLRPKSNAMAQGGKKSNMSAKSAKPSVSSVKSKFNVMAQNDHLKPNR